MRLLEAADLIVHVGDFTGASVLEDLRELAPVEAVHGNMDAPELLRMLPARQVVDRDGIRVGLVHDPGSRHGRHERLRSAFAGCDLVAYGHTHVPEIARSGDAWIVNPGSPTDRRRAPAHTMVVVRDGTPQLVELSG